MNARRHGLVALLVVLPVLALGACSSLPKPDLHRLYSFAAPGEQQDLHYLYSSQAADDVQPPVILVPGVLGSKLRNRETGEEIWPGSTWQLLFGRKENLAVKFDPQTLEALPDSIEAGGLFEEAFGQDFYGAILRTLEKSGGYIPTKPGTAVDSRQRRYYVFTYDWRQDNTITAGKLDALIEQIRRDYKNPALKVDVIAHSMGGLITRYFLRYGTADAIEGDDFPINLKGAAKLRTLILLGTPNLGSISSLQAFIEGAKYGLRPIPTEVLATMPSLYQLFPHPLNDWLVNTKGQVLDRDLFDTTTWRDFRWSIFDRDTAARMRERGADAPALERYFEKHLERARRFMWALTVELPDTPVKNVVFGGDCTLTPARLVVEPVNGEWLTRLTPESIESREPGVDYQALMLEPGDGSVTKPSLLARQNLNPTAPRDEHIFFPLAYSFFLCERHDRLAGNINFQDNLLNVLLSGERPWDQPLRIEKEMQSKP